MNVPEEASDGTVASGKHSLIGDWLLSLETSAGKPSCKCHPLLCQSDVQRVHQATKPRSHVQQPALGQGTGRQPTEPRAACFRIGEGTVPVMRLPGQMQQDSLPC